MRGARTAATVTVLLLAGAGATEAARSPGPPPIVHWEKWDVTSGSMFVREGVAYTGRPDAEQPSPWAGGKTGSAVFRATRREPVFDEGSVAFMLVVHDLTETDRTPPRDWDGVHVFLRWQDPETFYSVSVFRRDGQVVVKKKLPRPSGEERETGGDTNGGSYSTLAESRARPEVGEPTSIVVAIQDLDDDRVEIALSIDGREVLRAVDESDVIDTQGRAGLRGDNAEFSFSDFSVRGD